MLSLTEGGTDSDTTPLFGGQAAATPPSLSMLHSPDAEQVLASSAGHWIFHAHGCNLSSPGDCRKRQMSPEQV